MIIDTFLYNGLSYDINMGKKPLLLGGVKVNNFVSVPFIEWQVDFGLMDESFKNYIENLLIQEESFTLVTKIHPSVNLIYVESTNLLSYIYPHEISFYGVDKVDTGRNLVHTFVDPQITYNTNIYDKNSLATLPSGLSINHKVHFLDDSISVTHKTNGLFQVKAKFKEFFSPVDETYTVIGESSASNPEIG